MKVANLFLFALYFGTTTTVVDAHGMVTSPRSRQWVAYEDGIEGSQPGRPPREYCYQCANRNNGVCGYTPSYDYDQWLDSTGQPMAWKSQATYDENGIITIDLRLTAHHWGHAEVSACPMGRASTQACFDAHRLEFVNDNFYGMPADLSYPERGYFKFPGPSYQMQFRLPSGVRGDQVLLQWKYITANSCSPPGYPQYFGNNNAESWNSNLGTCDLPYPQDGSVSVPGKRVPEQFFNCIEVSVGGPSPGNAPVAPPVSSPVAPPVLPPVPSPVAPPVLPPVPSPVAPPVSAPVSPPVGSTGGSGMCCPAGYSGLRPYGDCRSFYHCVNGEVIDALISCASGLLFDDSLKNCNWASSVQCVQSGCGGAPVASPPVASPVAAPPVASPVSVPDPIICFNTGKNGKQDYGCPGTKTKVCVLNGREPGFGEGGNACVRCVATENSKGNGVHVGCWKRKPKCNAAPGQAGTKCSS